MLAASNLFHIRQILLVIALSFYVPIIFGSRYIPIVLIGFVITDLIIGFHSTFFLQGSIILIGATSKYFKIIFFIDFRILVSCIIFYVVSNFGVWLQGSYGYNLVDFLIVIF